MMRMQTTGEMPVGCHYALLENEALLQISGPDTLAFLQGQLTCDTRALSPARALPGAFCNPQGRVTGDFLLCQPGPEQVLLRLRRSVAATFAAALKKYMVFSRASLDADDGDWQLLALWGESAGEMVSDLCGSGPGARYGAVAGEGWLLVQVDEAGRQFECYLQPAAAGLLSGLEARAQLSSEGRWRALQVAAGVPRIEATTSGEFLPQALNYDLTGHVCFTKGCYTGQEIIARLHYRGRPKRRCHLAMLAGGTAPLPEPGTALYRPGATQAAGHVLNAESDDAGGTVLLVTAAGAELQDGLAVGNPAGPRLRPGTLPYPLPAD